MKCSVIFAGVAFTLISSITPVRADTGLEEKARPIAENAAKVMIPVALADAITAACTKQAPQDAAKHDAALKAWRTTNGIPDFETTMEPFMRNVSAFGKLKGQMTTATAEQAKAMIAKSPATCAQLQTVFAHPSFAVGGKVAETKEQLRTLIAAVKGGQPSDTPAPVVENPRTVYTLAQLSTLAEESMDRVMPVEKAKDRKEKSARHTRGEEELAKLGIIATTGRIIYRDKIREWRGDQQSTFSLRCRSFIDDATKARFEASQGQTITLAGKINSVYSNDHGGGSFAIERCRILPDASALAKGSFSEARGLELRPPEAFEANAGAGKGLALGDLTKVVYKAEFQPMMDGFGNGYMMRDERTYLLLKDGTAYRYEWEFPPTDLNVALVKQRHPQNWYRWKESGNTIEFTAIHGRDAGKVQTLVAADTLEPIKPGTVFNEYYYFKNVGMGGMRSDRGYQFHADGTGSFSFSGFMASQLGYGGPPVDASGPGFAYSGGGGTSPGFISATGKSGERKVRYRIDGYTLEVTGEDGKISRSFIARFGSDKSAVQPRSLYFEGEVLWTKDKDGK